VAVLLVLAEAVAGAEGGALPGAGAGEDELSVGGISGRLPCGDVAVCGEEAEVTDLSREQVEVLEVAAPWLLSDPEELRGYNVEQLRTRLGHKSRRITYAWLRRNGIPTIKGAVQGVKILRSDLVDFFLRINIPA